MEVDNEISLEKLNFKIFDAKFSTKVKRKKMLRKKTKKDDFNPNDLFETE